MPDTATVVGCAGTVLGTGFGGAWLRERRRGRKDAGELALSLIEAQGRRIDALTLELGRVQGELTAERRQNAELLAANLRLEADLAALRGGRRASD
jgi:hypothetical protein